MCSDQAIVPLKPWFLGLCRRGGLEGRYIVDDGFLGRPLGRRGNTRLYQKIALALTKVVGLYRACKMSFVLRILQHRCTTDNSDTSVSCPSVECKDRTLNRREERSTFSTSTTHSIVTSRATRSSMVEFHRRWQLATTATFVRAAAVELQLSSCTWTMFLLDVLHQWHVLICR